MCRMLLAGSSEVDVYASDIDHKPAVDTLQHKNQTIFLHNSTW